MLINPNLLDITKTTHTGAPYDFNTKIARVGSYAYARLQFELPDNLVVGQEYTFSCEIDNIDGNKELDVLAYPNTVPIAETFLADNGRQAYTFKLDDEHTHIYLYLGIKGNTKGSYKIYNIKLEEGTEATTYVPYKDDLQEDKQPLLPPEGHYKEITPL